MDNVWTLTVNGESWPIAHDDIDATRNAFLVGGWSHTIRTADGDDVEVLMTQAAQVTLQRRPGSGSAPASG